MLMFGSCFAGAGDTGESCKIKLLSPKDIEIKVCASQMCFYSLRNQCGIGDLCRIMRELCPSSYILSRVIVKTCATPELDDHHSAVNVASPFYVSLRLRNPLCKSVFIKNTSPTFAERHFQRCTLRQRNSRLIFFPSHKH